MGEGWDGSGRCVLSAEGPVGVLGAGLTVAIIFISSSSCFSSSRSSGVSV